MKQLLTSIIGKWTGTNLVTRICIGLILGATLGIFCPEWESISILGNVFVSALKAIAPILVMVLVLSSVINAQGNVGPRFRTVITLYMGSTLLAALSAVMFSYLFPITLELKDATQSAAPGGLGEIFKSLITGMVSNPVSAVAEANYIAVLFWAIVIGLALKTCASPRTKEAIADISDAVSKTIGWIIQCAPFGILGLVFSSVSKSGLEIFSTYSQLLLLLAGGMLFAALVLNPLLVAIMLKKNPYPLVWQCLKVSGINAFFTRSSAANIPINMALCKQLGIEKDFYSVSIPLGATINMNGAAVTITVMTLALAHTLGMDISIASAIFLSILASLAACGTSGVAGGSLLLIPMAASLFGISNDIAMQAVTVGFIIGVIQDSVETALNSSGDVLFTATAEMYENKKK